MNDESTQQLFQRLTRALVNAMPEVWAVYAYGSMVKGGERADSDLDLGVLTPPGKKISNLLELRAELADLAGREVDIVDLRNAGTMLCKEVLAEGVELYSAHHLQTLAWEATAMNEYAVHQFRIRNLLDDFKRTGVGYHR